MRRLALLAALLLIAIGALRVASTWRQMSVTMDEPYHFSCGLDYLALHRLCVVENPLLAPIAIATLPYLTGTRPDTSIEARGHEVTYRDRSEIAREELQGILLRSPDPWRTIVLMRAGVLPFFVAAGLVVFFGARRLFGDGVAVLSTGIFTFVPTVLAHAGLATTDMAATATIPGAFFVLVWWSESPTWRRSVCLGAVVGLMLFSKFSGAGFLAVAAVLAVWFHRPVGMARERIRGLLLGGIVAAFVLLAGYRFDAARIVASFQELLQHSRMGHPSYLMGQVSNHGFWLYYPVALAVKTPLPLLLLLPPGLWACWKRRDRGGLLPVAFVLGVLLTALPSRINLGTRHILPIFAGFSIIAALGVVKIHKWLGGGRSATVAAAFPLVWLAISGARAHPDYLAYFNGLAGEHPDYFLLDSDLDWEQDWALAGLYLRERGATAVTIDIGRNGPFHSPDILERVDGLPPVRETTWEESADVPAPGWHILSTTKLRTAPPKEELRRAIGSGTRIGGLYLFLVPHH